MSKFDDMSRDELLKAAKSMSEVLLGNCTSFQCSPCSFCQGSGWVPDLRQSIRQELVTKWFEKVTMEEHDEYMERTYGHLNKAR